MGKVTLKSFSYFIQGTWIQRWGTEKGIGKISTAIFPIPIIRQELNSAYELEESEVIWDEEHPGIVQFGFEPSKQPNAIEIPGIIYAKTHF